MPTVISDEHRFAFLHIPKTAGTTVGRQLSVLVPSDPRFHHHHGEDPRVGAFWWQHLTLDEMAILVPETLDKVRDYDSTAVLRDPKGRFRSALGNHILKVHDRSASHLRAAAVRETADRVMDRCERDDLTELHMGFFKPQVRYVERSGERYLTRLFEIGSLPALADHVERATGAKVNVETRLRVAKSFRRGPLAFFRALRPLVEGVLPSEAARRLKTKTKSALAQDRDDVIEEIVASPRARRLFDDFYGRDRELFEEARSAGAPAPSASVRPEGELHVD